MKKNQIISVLGLSLLIFFNQTHQVEAVEYQSPRTLGLGGAGRGAPLLNDAIYLNPSYASFTPVYSIATGYDWFSNNEASGRNYNVSIQDSRTELFQAGVGFTRREQNASINFGASKQVIQRLGIGLGSKTLIDDQTNKMTTDFMYSTSFIASQWIYASVIIDNVIDSSDAQNRNLYRDFFIGTKIILVKEVQLYIDPHYTPNYPYGKKFGWSAGVEFAMLADFYLRAGRFLDSEITYLNTRGEGFGLGLGWIGPKFNVDYALNRVTDSNALTPLTTAHAVSLTMFF
jgi:hypothetical protein